MPTHINDRVMHKDARQSRRELHKALNSKRIVDSKITLEMVKTQAAIAKSDALTENGIKLLEKRGETQVKVAKKSHTARLEAEIALLEKRMEKSEKDFQNKLRILELREDNLNHRNASSQKGRLTLADKVTNNRKALSVHLEEIRKEREEREQERRDQAFANIPNGPKPETEEERLTRKARENLYDKMAALVFDIRITDAEREMFLASTQLQVQLAKTAQDFSRINAEIMSWRGSYGSISEESENAENPDRNADGLTPPPAKSIYDQIDENIQKSKDK